jgi:8-oxo-dGTP pyrophosphatase MutT (NUDIX family)
MTGEYRRGVGVMLLSADKQVWVGRRIDNTDEAWQMPQGGIDEGEAPWATALRELEEETGIPPHLVERIAECPERLRYDLPEELRRSRTGSCAAFWGARATSTSPPPTRSFAIGSGFRRGSCPRSSCRSSATCTAA